jgi:aspartate-semialdehyde dehydrogenase
MKVVWETRKILGDAGIEVNVTAVRVPVLVGHSASVNMEFEKPYTLGQATDLLSAMPGLKVMNAEGPNGYPTPVNAVAGKDDAYVGRIRRDISHPNALNCWVVVDNLRKGAALNAIQIGELLIESGRVGA